MDSTDKTYPRRVKLGVFLVFAAVLMLISSFVTGAWKGSAMHDVFYCVKTEKLCETVGTSDRACWLSWSNALDYPVAKIREYGFTPQSTWLFRVLSNAFDSARISVVNKPDSLVSQLIMSLMSFILLVIGCGYILTGCYGGLLVDANTNRLSLSRVQAVLWGTVLLGSYSTLVSFNQGFGAEMAYFLPGDVVAFPSMDMSLWTLLGVVSASPMASAYFSGEPKTAQSDNPPEKARTSCSQAKWLDILTGTADSAAQDPRLTRIQCVFITVVLLMFYFFNVLNLVFNITWERLIYAVNNGYVMYKSMPGVDATFVFLLGASHAVFQGAKSTWAAKLLGK